MDDNDRRNIKDFYAHRKLVLERIKRSIEQEKKERKK